MRPARAQARRRDRHRRRAARAARAGPRRSGRSAPWCGSTATSTSLYERARAARRAPHARGRTRGGGRRRSTGAASPTTARRDLTVDTTGLGLDQVVAELVRALRALPPATPAASGGAERAIACPPPSSRRLAERPLLCDGAMGTMLYARGVAARRLLRRAERQRAQARPVDPRRVHRSGRRLHRDQHLRRQPLQAGSTHGLAGARARDQPCAGPSSRATCARARAATCSCWARSARSASTWRRSAAIEPEEARDAFREQAEGLLEGGVDAFVVETFSDLDEMRLAVEAIRALTDLPILAEVTFTDDGVTFTGPHAGRGGARAAGAAGPGGGRQLLGRLERALRHPRADAARGRRPAACRIQPNAGLPSRVGERLMYLSSPDLHGGLRGAHDRRGRADGRRLLRHDARSTSRAMREALDRLAPQPGAAARARRSRRCARRDEQRAGARHQPPRPPCSSAGSTRGEFVVTVELDPPRGHNIEKLVQGAKLLKERGVEIVDINDGSLGPRAHVGAADRDPGARRDRARHQHALHVSRPEPDGHPGRSPRRPRDRTSATSWP